MTIVVATLAALAAGGLYLVVTGVTGFGGPRARVDARPTDARGRALAAVLAAAAGGLLTRCLLYTSPSPRD